MLKDKIKELCKAHGISIMKLENDLQLGSGTVAKWNKAVPKVDTMAKVADYFGVSVDYLLGREKPMSDEEFRAVFDARHPFDPQLFSQKGPVPPEAQYIKRFAELFSQMDEEDKKIALAQMEALANRNRESAV